MNEHEMERFEAELRRLAPAHPPEQFMEKLKAARPGVETVQAARRQSAATTPGWWQLWRWLAPALAVALACLLVTRQHVTSKTTGRKAPLATAYASKAGDVQVDQELVSSFDVVAKLPGGEPVRFHCRKWNDQLVVKDTNGGVEIVQNTPRVEVVPVRFETY